MAANSSEAVLYQEEVYLQLVSDEDDGLVAKLLPDGVAEDVVGHVGVEGAEGVVQDVNVPVAVEGTGQADSLALPTTQVGTTLADLMETRRSSGSWNSFYQSKLVCEPPAQSTVCTKVQTGSDVTSVRSALGSRARSGLRQQALSTD